VATNDVHFLERSHHEAHDVMICIGTGSMVHDERRMRYPTDVYFKSPQEMAALFADCPDALTNTLRIAEMCDLKLEFGVSKYPAYEPPTGKTRENYLRELCYEGLSNRFGDRAQTDQELRNRLAHPAPGANGAPGTPAPAPAQMADAATSEPTMADNDSHADISRLESENHSVAVWSEPRRDTTVIWLPDQP